MVRKRDKIERKLERTAEILKRGGGGDGRLNDKVKRFKRRKLVR